MKRTALLAVAALLFVQQAVASPWLKDIASAQKKAKEKNQLIFVDLFADWCGWCHRFEQEVIPSQAFQSSTDNMVLLRLNTEDGKDGTKFAQEFSINSLPTFLLLNSDLMIAGMIKGYIPSTEIAKTIEGVEGTYKDFSKRVADEPNIAKDYAKRLALAKEFESRAGYAQSEMRLKKLVSEPGIPTSVRDDTYFELALTQILQKKFDDARKTIAQFAKVQNKGDAYERSRLLVGDIYMQQGNVSAALNEYRGFKAKYPNSQYNHNLDMMIPQLERQLGTPRK
ncbi:MAG TPA: thioredoxin fold domain-containing protein [Thermoanaerobaculia bacterium]|nr:thioredoxin fold domain-containing protein [Thermoanaerobaculia bacterium]